MSLELKLDLSEYKDAVLIHNVAQAWLRRSYTKHWTSRAYSLSGGVNTELDTGLTAIEFVLVVNKSSSTATVNFYKKLSPEYITFTNSLLLVGTSLAGFSLKASADAEVEIFLGGS